MKRIVHLDFKGAPPKIPFLEQVILSAKEWGATGLLIEWEDTFPYSGMLAEIGSSKNRDGMYTLEEVKHILQFANDYDMEVIQLIQTMGHMEFVLKHPAFLALREEPKAAAALCPLRERGQEVVREMARQVLQVQPDAKFLHIGADEVWYLGTCPDCKDQLRRTEANPSSLFLQHISSLARSLKELYPNLTVLMWDDMLRTTSVEEMKKYDLGTLVQPVVWNYNTHENFNIPPALWRNYRQVFEQCWAASAFKGAHTSCQIVPEPLRYVSNNMAWMREIMQHAHDVNFAGIILTGWSRFDHYATFCELLPVAMPSLASCLRAVTTMTAEDCIDIQPRQVELDSLQWAGQPAAIAIEKFARLRTRCRQLLYDDTILTWLNPWQIANNYTNPMHVATIAQNAHQLQSELLLAQPALGSRLGALLGAGAREEWLNSLVTPLTAHITALYVEADRRRNMDAPAAPSRSY